MLGFTFPCCCRRDGNVWVGPCCARLFGTPAMPFASGCASLIGDERATSRIDIERNSEIAAGLKPMLDAIKETNNAGRPGSLTLGSVIAPCSLSGEPSTRLAMASGIGRPYAAGCAPQPLFSTGAHEAPRRRTHSARRHQSPGFSRDSATSNRPPRCERRRNRQVFLERAPLLQFAGRRETLWCTTPARTTCHKAMSSMRAKGQKEFVCVEDQHLAKLISISRDWQMQC